MNILTARVNGDGWIVNGNTGVPNNPDNRHYKAVQDWILEGNTPDAQAIEVPSSASKLRIYEVLRDSGQWPAVEAALVGDALNSWNFATIIDRNHPLMSGFQAQLGWTDQQVDDLFTAAQ